MRLNFRFVISAIFLSLASQMPLTAQNIGTRISESLGNDAINLSLILPLNSKNYENQDYNNFIDFYQGVLLAAEDAKKLGISTNLNIFDSDDYPDMNSLIYSGRLDRSDIIIGPVYFRNVSTLLPYANAKQIPLVSPMDPKAESLVADNPYLFQTTTPIRNQQENLLSYLKPEDHITVIYEQGHLDREMSELTLSILNERHLRYNSFSYSLDKDKSNYGQIESKLIKDGVNHIIIPSGSEAFVYDVLRNLNLLNTMGGYKIKIYGTPKWRNFELVDLSYLHSMNLTLSVPYYVDYEQQAVKDFLFRYRALFNNEPSAYAFQGYDLTMLFLKYRMQFGGNFRKIRKNTESMLQSDYKFVKTSPDGGYVNSATRKIEYLPDFSIKSSSFDN